jgi:hypothetical protein
MEGCNVVPHRADLGEVDGVVSDGSGLCGCDLPALVASQGSKP